MAIFCIVTVHHNTNCGSFLQAWALGHAIKSLGHEVLYLKKKNYSLFYCVKNLLKKCIKADFLEAVRIYKAYKEFKTCRKEFVLVNINDIDIVDCVILGSDTIWDIDVKYFKNYRNIYWGQKFSEKNIITYAGSVGNTSLEIIKIYPELKESVCNWNYISVRDKNTRRIISLMTNKKIYMVCDPTMLIHRKDYMKLVEAPKEDRYILLYLFNDLSKTQEKELCELAKNKKLLIISTASGKKVSDKRIIRSPLKFVQYMLYADYVITDTFHGAVFSVNLNRQFVVIDRNKNKVNDFLNYVKFTDRIVAENQSVLSVINKRIDYEKYKEVIENFRKRSLEFLKMAVNEVTNYKQSSTF